jgi:hypothetical protein
MPAQSKIISEKGVLSNQSDFERCFWIVKRLADANEIWKYINPDDSERVNLEEPAAEPTASSATATTVWKEKKKGYRSAKEGMAKLEKHITETLDAKLHGLLTPCATVAEQVKVLYDRFNQSLTQQYLDCHGTNPDLIHLSLLSLLGTLGPCCLLLPTLASLGTLPPCI